MNTVIIIITYVGRIVVSMTLLFGAPKLPRERAENEFALECKLAKALGGLLTQTQGLLTAHKGCVYFSCQ